MAQRRMFSKNITDTDLFLSMPLSTQCLYFHLNMNADDDGFVDKAKTIMRMIGSSEDDIKILLTKEFILPFDSGVVVVKDWKIHNYIRKDRYNETIYKEEKALLSENENGQYERLTSGIPVVDQRLPQVRLGKDRLGKDSKDSPKSLKRYSDDSPYMQLTNLLEEKIKNRDSKFKVSNKQTWSDDFRKLVELDDRPIEEVKQVINWCQSDSFWQTNILSASKLRKQYSRLLQELKKKQPQNLDTTDMSWLDADKLFGG